MNHETHSYTINRKRHQLMEWGAAHPHILFSPVGLEAQASSAVDGIVSSLIEVSKALLLHKDVTEEEVDRAYIEMLEWNRARNQKKENAHAQAR